MNSTQYTSGEKRVALYSCETSVEVSGDMSCYTVPAVLCIDFYGDKHECARLHLFGRFP